MRKRCPKCGKKIDSVSMITGKYYPCGHRDPKISKEDLGKNREALRAFNKIVSKALR